jgi:hypothetical protein
VFDEQSDNELISYATEMWANYIETYCVSMSAKNAVERNHKNEDFKIKYHYEPNHLASYQKRLVKRLRELSVSYKKENNG